MKKMKKIYLMLLLITTCCWSQDWPTEEFIKKHNYLEVIGYIPGNKEKPSNLKYAMYPNGINGINNVIKNNFKYPAGNVHPTNNGRVLLGYIVDINGEIIDIQVLESAGKPFDDEAKRVLKRMKKWIPGKENGEPVQIAYTQPFRFR